MHDPITFKVFSPHIHIVFLKNTGNVFDMASLQLLAIKPKTWRDLVSDEPFKREDIITIQVGYIVVHRLTSLCQDPSNLSSRDLSQYDYVKQDKKVEGKLKGPRSLSDLSGRACRRPSTGYQCRCSGRCKQSAENARREGMWC